MERKPCCYEIVVEGRLESSWAEWFADMTCRHAGHATTLLGTVPDEAALHGLLNRIRDLGLTLISVRRMPEGSDIGAAYPCSRPATGRSRTEGGEQS